MKTQDFTTEAIDKVKSQFEKGETIILGCTVNVIRKNEAYQYETQNGKIATMSARYWGTITFPAGTKKDFKKVKGGEISRACGFGHARKGTTETNKVIYTKSPTVESSRTKQ